jgi:starch phosphorylase
MEIDGFDSLVSLAMDMRWSWNNAADELWQQLDPALWEQTHNPWLVLQTVSGDQLRRQLTSPSFREKVDTLIRTRELEDSKSTWFRKDHPDASLSTVAYFSMEYMLSEALPIYVGGLGNVAGDQLKSASDLGVPVIAVGLLYQQGYFRQYIDAHGEQEAYTPYNDPGQLPVTPLRLPNGEWLRIEIPLRGYPVWLRVWQVQVGRVKLYLLDSNDAANIPVYRSITGEIYGGGPEMRIKQEVILGIGGWRLLETLGITPDVCHLNEGHAAFAVLERAYSYMQKTGATFEVALTITRAGNLFTTHTAVAAGFDHFDPALLIAYLGEYATKRLNISDRDLMALGRQDPDNTSESFNMAYLAIRGSGRVNGVSRLHGLVSRHIFEPLFDRWPTEEVPVAHVTNGVHMPSWESPAADELWTEACGKDRWLDEKTTMTENILRLSDARIWEMRTKARTSLIQYIRQRQVAELTSYGASQETIGDARKLLDPNVLTIGFARRFVAYKRTDLLLHDPDRLVRLLTNHKQPVQLVIAGKAPPSDEGGKDLIRRWIQFIRRTGTSQQVIFLNDYDMLLAEHLVEGMDVWLNTPRRPWEASGTSGMKVLPNGGVNLSELDGWWVEAYTPDVGWALGDGLEHGDDPSLDGREAEDLFNLLEQQVIPDFYTRNAENIPVSWVNRIRKSMATLTPRFSAGRTVREYTEKHYLPAANAYHLRAGDQGAKGKQIVQWKHTLETHWPKLRFGDIRIKTENEKHLFEVQVFLGDLDPGAILIELYAQGLNGANPVRLEMKATGSSSSPGIGSSGSPPIGSSGSSPIGSSEPTTTGPSLYSVSVPATRPAGDYTPRLIPRHEGVSIPLEEPAILWQR